MQTHSFRVSQDSSSGASNGLVNLTKCEGMSNKIKILSLGGCVLFEKRVPCLV